MRDMHGCCDWSMPREKVPHSPLHFLVKSLQTTILQKSDPTSLPVFYAYATGGDSRSSTYFLPMREVQNSPVFFTSRWLFGLRGRFPVREVQNFAGICTSRIRHEMYSVFSLIRDINKHPDPSMSRQLFLHMPRFPARDMHGCCDWSMSREIFIERRMKLSPDSSLDYRKLTDVGDAIGITRNVCQDV